MRGREGERETERVCDTDRQTDRDRERQRERVPNPCMLRKRPEVDFLFLSESRILSCTVSCWF